MLIFYIDKCVQFLYRSALNILGIQSIVRTRWNLNLVLFSDTCQYSVWWCSCWDSRLGSAGCRTCCWGSCSRRTIARSSPQWPAPLTYSPCFPSSSPTTLLRLVPVLFFPIWSFVLFKTHWLFFFYRGCWRQPELSGLTPFSAQSLFSSFFSWSLRQRASLLRKLSNTSGKNQAKNVVFMNSSIYCDSQNYRNDCPGFLLWPFISMILSSTAWYQQSIIALHNKLKKSHIRTCFNAIPTSYVL